MIPHNVIWAPPYPNFPKFVHHLHRYNSVRVHQYAQPQHMKVLKHFKHIQYRCEMQSAVVYSFNHDTPQCHLGYVVPQFSKILPPSAQV
jgi:hypothetical protein